jgi:hypothetical protein
VDAFYRRDFAAACAAMAPVMQDQIAAGGTCARGLAATLGNARPAGPKPRIETLRVLGRNATGRAKSADGSLAVVYFAKRHGKWKMTTGTKIR